MSSEAGHGLRGLGMFCVLWARGIDSPHALVEGGEGGPGQRRGSQAAGCAGKLTLQDFARPGEGSFSLWDSKSSFTILTSSAEG